MSFTKEFIEGGTVNYDLTNFMPNFRSGQCQARDSVGVERVKFVVRMKNKERSPRKEKKKKKKPK